MSVSHYYSEKMKTQKAKGLVTLGKYGESVFGTYGMDTQTCNQIEVWPHKSLSEIFAASYVMKFPCFARPCPTVPRHGFVESRVVNNMAEAEQVTQEARAQDENAEVIFMPKMSSRWSGIATQSGIAFGKKNDGATSGHDVKVVPSYVSASKFRYIVSESLCSKSNVHDGAYVEFVEHHDLPMLVQLRNGPELPRTRNYIPNNFVVRKVLTVDPAMELLAWESLIESVKDEIGLVVHHANGALSSHFAVHCIVHNIPIVLDHTAPVVGQELAKSEWTPKKLSVYDYVTVAKFLARRFRKGFPSNALDEKGGALTAVATLHACAQWGSEEHLLRLRAEGFAAILAYTVAACMGEMRHWYQCGPGYHHDCPVSLFNKKDPGFYFDPKRRRAKRDVIFHKAFDQDGATMAKLAYQAMEGFSIKGWGGGYGGKNWADAARVTVDGFKAASRFLNDPCEKSWQDVMVHYNRIVNAVHNGGTILTKWISQTSMNRLAENPSPGFINGFTAKICLRLDRLPRITEDDNEGTECMTTLPESVNDYNTETV